MVWDHLDSLFFRYSSLEVNATDTIKYAYAYDNNSIEPL